MGIRPLRNLRRFGVPVVLVTVAIAGLLRYVSDGSSDPASAALPVPPQPTSPIQHIVFIMKENRSFDEYFGKFPNANGATTGNTSDGSVITLGATPDPTPGDISHTTPSWVAAYDGGKMDGFDKEGGSKSVIYSQMSESSIPNYWAYARTYGLADNAFADAHGASFANNIFEFAAQDGQYDNQHGGRTVSEIPVTGFSPELPNPWGCDSPPDSLESMTDSNGARSLAFPCFGYRALPNVLADAGIPWAVYRSGRSSAHNALDALRSVRFDPTLWSHMYPLTQFTSDASSLGMPAVSWIVSGQSEHPPQSACAGENETVKYVNAIMNGPNWSSTAIVVAWDEWGGFYDHVAPPQVDSVSYGFRVPFLVISPYVKVGNGSNGGYVSHTFYSFESVLKLIETNWGLPSLTPKDAAANDMLDMFDFASPQRPTLVLSTRRCTPLTAAQLRIVAHGSPD